VPLLGGARLWRGEGPSRSGSKAEWRLEIPKDKSHSHALRLGLSS
jgi:hypothetical protein